MTTTVPRPRPAAPTSAGLPARLPADLPADVRHVLSSSLVCEYASLTRDGRPVTWPMGPYVGARGTLDISTGLAYPDKAERARRNPHVALLYSNPLGLGRGRHPVVLVQGRAAVRDADLQGNTDRYLRESLPRTPGFDGMPWFVLRRLGWYFARIWVEVTPEQIQWWPEGDLAAAPQTWRAAPRDVFPTSDPAPAPSTTAHGRSGPTPDRTSFADRAARLGAPVLTTTVAGRPVPLRVRQVQRTSTGFAVVPPEGGTWEPGPACLTFHVAEEGLRTQENVVLLGRIDADAHVTVDRPLPDWSIAGSRAFLRQGRVLKPRLAVEAARRGQQVPTMNRSARG